MDEAEEVMTQQMLRVPPWIWALLVSLLVQFGGAVWVTATMAAKIDTLTSRIDRLERQIDSITNVTRGGSRAPLAP